MYVACYVLCYVCALVCYVFECSVCCCPLFVVIAAGIFTAVRSSSSSASGTFSRAHGSPARASVEPAVPRMYVCAYVCVHIYIYIYTHINI